MREYFVEIHGVDGDSVDYCIVGDHVSYVSALARTWWHQETNGQPIMYMLIDGKKY
jgi:hypothetical protein